VAEVATMEAFGEFLVATMILLVGIAIALPIWILCVVSGLVLLVIPKLRFLSAHLMIPGTLGAMTANLGRDALDTQSRLIFPSWTSRVRFLSPALSESRAYVLRPAVLPHFQFTKADSRV
jgi:hypothetical protein